MLKFLSEIFGRKKIREQEEILKKIPNASNQDLEYLLSKMELVPWCIGAVTVTECLKRLMKDLEERSR